jgi:hypothetical protein
MHQKQRWSLVVLLLSAGAYIPLAIGGYSHPTEINVASYSLWMIISGMFLYSSHSQGFAGWRMPLGFFIGNGSLLTLGLAHGGYTFNLGPAETIALYGIIGTISVWAAVGLTTKKWKPRILFLGGIIIDVLSFYPQLKQYLLPHESPTTWMILGWSLWVLGAFINIVLVEKLFKKLTMTKTMYEKSYGKTKKPLLVLEESAFSVENCLFMFITIIVMTR